MDYSLDTLSIKIWEAGRTILGVEYIKSDIYWMPRLRSSNLRFSALMAKADYKMEFP